MSYPGDPGKTRIIAYQLPYFFLEKKIALEVSAIVRTTINRGIDEAIHMRIREYGYETFNHLDEQIQWESRT